MIPHRVLVRDKVAEILAASVPPVEGRVFRARTLPLSPTDLPALLVYGWQEEMKRTGGTAMRSFYAVSFILAVELRLDPRRASDGEAAEIEIEAIAGLVTHAVTTAAALLLPPERLIERIDGIKTTLGIDGRGGEVALGAALIAFDLAWTETFEVPEPPIDCGDATLALRPDPARWA